MGKAMEGVYLTCFAPEFSRLATVVQYSGIRLHRAETLQEADFLLTVSGATMLLTDVTFLDGTWRDALRLAAETHPLALALIAAQEVDRPFLAEAHELGAGGVLWKPIDFMVAIDWIQTAHQAACDRAQWLAERGWPDQVSNRGSQAPGPESPFWRAAA